MFLIVESPIIRSGSSSITFSIFSSETSSTSFRNESKLGLSFDQDSAPTKLTHNSCTVPAKLDNTTTRCGSAGTSTVPSSYSYVIVPLVTSSLAAISSYTDSSYLLPQAAKLSTISKRTG